MRFFKCTICGNVISHLYDSGVRVVCCGKEMVELIPNTVDAATEKHVPVYEIKDNKVYVTIGSEEHPMTDEHHIEWVAIETKMGNQRKILKAADKPKVCFALCEGDKVENVYAYCNLHGLWMA